MADREVLIVDDDAPAREALADVLREHGYFVHMAGDGPAALSLLAKRATIEVMLTDVRLPGMDGVELLSKARLAYSHLHVILVTAFANRNMALRALRHGAADFLTKPVDGPTLLRVVERSFYRSRLDHLASTGQQAVLQPLSGTVLCSREGEVLEVSPEAAQLLALAGVTPVSGKIWDVAGHMEFRELFSSAPRSSLLLAGAGRSLRVQRVGVTPAITGILLLITDVGSIRQLQRDLNALRQDIESRVIERTRFLSEEIEFNDRLLDTADLLIAYVNPEGVLERWNKFAIELTGLPIEQANARIGAICFQRDSPLCEIFDPQTSSEVTGRVLPFEGPEGTQRLVTWSARRFREAPGRWGRLVVGLDVTEQKQLESTLQHYNSYLEDILRQRSRELKTKNAQLIHTARLASLGEMVGSIAHEMKQPLNVIGITSDLIKLLRKNGKLTDDLLENNLDKIRGTVERMANTINHLRGFTHIDSSTFKSLTAQQVLDGAMVLVGVQIRQEDIDVETELGENLPVFRGDRNQIEQVLVNLLINARDAVLEAQESAPSALRRAIKMIAGASEDSKWLTIEIVDRGVGMPAEVVRHIFEPFYTTKDASRGTGLGLSICLNIVRAHGGDIEVESMPGHGSTFRILLPVDVEADLTQDG